MMGVVFQLLEAVSFFSAFIVLDRFLLPARQTGQLTGTAKVSAQSKRKSAAKTITDAVKDVFHISFWAFRPDIHNHGIGKPKSMFSCIHLLAGRLKASAVISAHCRTTQQHNQSTLLRRCERPLNKAERIAAVELREAIASLTPFHSSFDRQLRAYALSCLCSTHGVKRKSAEALRDLTQLWLADLRTVYCLLRDDYLYRALSLDEEECSASVADLLDLEYLQSTFLYRYLMSSPLLGSVTSADTLCTPGRPLHSCPGSFPLENDHVEKRKALFDKLWPEWFKIVPLALRTEDPAVSSSALTNDERFPKFDAIKARPLWRVIRTKLSASERKPGHIYIYCTPSDPEYLKIGYTKGNAEKRVSGWCEQCQHDVEILYSSSERNEPAKPVINAKRIERIVHAQFASFRHYDARCRLKSNNDLSSAANGRNPCTKLHDEWFKIPLAEAQAAVEYWCNWMERDCPYDKLGKLRHDRLLNMNETEDILDDASKRFLRDYEGKYWHQDPIDDLRSPINADVDMSDIPAECNLHVQTPLPSSTRQSSSWETASGVSSPDSTASVFSKASTPPTPPTTPKTNKGRGRKSAPPIETPSKPPKARAPARGSRMSSSPCSQRPSSDDSVDNDDGTADSDDQSEDSDDENVDSDEAEAWGCPRCHHQSPVGSKRCCKCQVRFLSSSPSRPTTPVGSRRASAPARAPSSKGKSSAFGLASSRNTKQTRSFSEGGGRKASVRRLPEDEDVSEYSEDSSYRASSGVRRKSSIDRPVKGKKKKSKSTMRRAKHAVPS